MDNSLLQDHHGRIHDYLRISITENCNLRCKYCMPEEGIQLSPKSHIMTKDEILGIATEFVKLGVKKIRLTGGEPLVRKDAKEIIEGLAKLSTELTLTTNGLLVDEYIETFKNSRINSLNVSIDTLNKEKYFEITRRDNFDKLWQNIQLLNAEGFLVKLNVVLMKDFNQNEIIDFIQLTQNQNIQIRFIEFMPFDGNKWDKSKLVSLHEILTTVNNHFGDENLVRTNDKPNDTAKNYKIKGFEGSFSVISSVTNPFCSTCNRIRLTANGKLKNCLFSNTETSLLDVYRKGNSIIPLILENVSSKFAMRGGMDNDEKFQNPQLFSKNRSMIMIGG